MELDQVEIDHCLECEGIWLDSGELEILLEGTEGKDALLKSFHPARDNKERLRKCPICLKPMRKIFVVENQKVVIDQCSKLHGLWFDRGELEQVFSLDRSGHDTKVLRLLKDMFGKK